MVTLAKARAPEGLRLYAIGDIHGCMDLLGQTHAHIAQDLQHRPVDDWKVIHVGDYIDRGPDSAGVLSMLRNYDPQHSECLLGNHDQHLRDFLRMPDLEDFEGWMLNGGAETLDSFGLDGVTMAHQCREADMEAYRGLIDTAMPEETVEFLRCLKLWVSHGDYAFVHAGIMPGWSLEDQSDHDMLWIREPFLDSDLEHSHVIIHGHTPVEEVDVHPNRIGIDTGAVFSGVLTCLVLEGEERDLLGPDGPQAL